MKSLPTNALAYRQTAIFTQDTIPAGFLQCHNTKARSWGEICVISGKLRYSIFSDTAPEDYILTSTSPGVIEPQVLHQVAPIDSVEFYVEFYRETNNQTEPPSPELPLPSEPLLTG